MSGQIIVLGSNGMLGHMVKSYFNSVNIKVTSYNERFNADSFIEYIDGINSFEPATVINCIGRIKQKSDDPYSLLLANAILPLELSRSLKQGHRLIQPSTDCVFDGLFSDPYPLFASHTATDVYGWSKSLGESAVLSRSNSCVVRVSIVGPEMNTFSGLLSWYLNQPADAVLNGYLNHYWNGITTLEWCKFVHELILSGSIFDRNLYQLGTEQVYSKFALLNFFKSYFGKCNIIIPFEDKLTINRALKPTTFRKDIEQQLSELVEYMSSPFYQNTF